MTRADYLALAAELAAEFVVLLVGLGGFAALVYAVSIA
jgi:hypothetical protein